jgi:hypothetical protein
MDILECKMAVAGLPHGTMHTVFAMCMAGASDQCCKALQVHYILHPTP